MDIVIIPILQAIAGILGFYQIIIFVNIVFSWLLVLGVIDLYRYKILGNLFMITRMATEPLYNFVRRFLPTFGPMDFSPVIVIVAIYIITEIINRLIYKLSVVY